MTLTLAIIEQENGSDRDDFSEESISGIPLRKNTLEARFFSLESSKLFSYDPYLEPLW